MLSFLAQINTQKGDFFFKSNLDDYFRMSENGLFLRVTLGHVALWPSADGLPRKQEMLLATVSPGSSLIPSCLVVATVFLLSAEGKAG